MLTSMQDFAKKVKSNLRFSYTILNCVVIGIIGAICGRKVRSQISIQRKSKMCNIFVN